MKINWILKRLLLINLILCAILLPGQAAFAEDELPEQAVYVIQAGDSLWGVAHRLHVDFQSLLSANQLTENSQVIPGMELVIPGLEGIQGYLDTGEVHYGDSLRSLSRQYGLSEEVFIRLNRITIPSELYVGVSFVYLKSTPDAQDFPAVGRGSLAPEEPLLEMAVKEGINPWSVVLDNHLQGSWQILPGQVVGIPGRSSSGPGAFPEEIISVKLSPEELVQGSTQFIEITALGEVQVEGLLSESELHFFSDSPGLYSAMQGVHALARTGIVPLRISGVLSNGKPFSHEQMVRLKSGDFIYETFEGLPQEAVSQELSEQEDEIISAAAAHVSPEKLWNGAFQSPVPPELSDCWPSLYGNRRSLNGSGYYFYHSGLDFCGREGVEITAPAAGEVVFIDELSIRGHYTMIDHGRGLFTAYAHQSEVLVEVGERVVPGQVIGLVGTTGRSTGPHLHWEVWVGGIPVNPMPWLLGEIP